MTRSGFGQSELIAHLVDALAPATTVGGVLDAIVDVLGEPYSLCRVSLRRYLPESGDVEVVAVWSRWRSDIGPGVRMPLRSTSLANVLATGRVQIVDEVLVDDGLLHSLLKGEGIRSFATVPLGDATNGALVLSLSSSQPRAFVDDDLPLVEGVAASVAPVIERVDLQDE